MRVHLDVGETRRERERERDGGEITWKETRRDAGERDEGEHSPNLEREVARDGGRTELTN